MEHNFLSNTSTTTVKFFENNSALFYEITADISKIIPYGKVLLLSSVDNFLSFGKTIIKSLNERGNKVIGVVEDLDGILSIDKVCGLFTASEEIRGVIALNYKSFYSALYFATVKSLPVFLLPTTFPLDFGVRNQILLKNGSSYDKINIYADRYIYFNTNNIDENFTKNLGAYLFEKACVLIDSYATNKLLKELTNNDEHNNLINALIFAAFRFNISDTISIKTLINLCIKAEEQSGITSSAKVATELFTILKKGNINCVDVLLNVSNKLIDSYFSLLDTDLPPNLVDYRARAEEMQNIFGFNESEILKNYLDFSKKVLRNSKDLKSAFFTYFNDLNFIKAVLKILVDKFGLQKYIDSKKDNAINIAIKFCGDTPISFNGASILRELVG